MEETLWKIAKEAGANILCTTTKRVANCTTEVYGFCEVVTSIEHQTYSYAQNYVR